MDFFNTVNIFIILSGFIAGMYRTRVVKTTLRRKFVRALKYENPEVVLMGKIYVGGLAGLLMACAWPYILLFVCTMGSYDKIRQFHDELTQSLFNFCRKLGSYQSTDGTEDTEDTQTTMVLMKRYLR